MKFEIKNRWSGTVQHSVEIPAEVAGEEYGIQLGFAIKSAVFSYADLSGANLSGAYMIGAYLSVAAVKSCPVTIADIHKSVYAAASAPQALDMSNWHNVCGTTHCRAGWVVELAGDAGRALELALGTPAAAALIYMASDPKLERIPDFYCGNSEALADMKRLAEAEAAANTTPTDSI